MEVFMKMFIQMLKHLSRLGMISLSLVVVLSACGDDDKDKDEKKKEKPKPAVKRPTKPFTLNTSIIQDFQIVGGFYKDSPNGLEGRTRANEIFGSGTPTAAYNDHIDVAVFPFGVNESKRFITFIKAFKKRFPNLSVMENWQITQSENLIFLTTITQGRMILGSLITMPSGLLIAKELLSKVLEIIKIMSHFMT